MILTTSIQLKTNHHSLSLSCLLSKIYLRRQSGKGYANFQAFWPGCFGPYFALHPLDDFLGDSKSQTVALGSSASGFVGTIKGLKQPRKFLRRYPTTSICKLNLIGITLYMQVYVQPAIRAFLFVFNVIAEDIIQYAPELGRI